MAKKKPKTRIMVFGTFDVLHKGHLHFFKQAKRLAKDHFLIVSVARDINVKKIKGRPPLLPERKRLQLVRKSKWADEVILGQQKGFLKHILRARPALIALGHDQMAYTAGLKNKLKKAGLRVRIVRLKPFNRRHYSSSLEKKRRLLKV